MSGKLLMFAFHSLPVIAAVNKTMAELGVEVIPVMPRDYNKPLQSLVDKTLNGEEYAGAPLGGPMLVLCELKDRLEEVLPALQRAGVGTDCLKAVLTTHNRKWNAVKLYGELQQERMAMLGK